MAVIDSLFSAELQSCKDISTGVKDNLELRTSITTAETCPEIAGHGRQFSVIFPYTKWRAFYRALMEF